MYVPPDTAEPTPPTLRDAAETQLGQHPLPMLNTSAEALLHELQVHQIELEMQNESLRQAQLALEQSRDRYLNLYEFAPVGYLGLSETGQITDINLTGAKLIGIERRALIGSRLDGFVIPGDQFRLAHWLSQLRLRSDPARSIEVELMRTPAGAFHARLEGQLTENAGTLATLRLAISDVSERRRAELALAQYKDHLEDLVADRTADLRAKEARIAHFSRLTAILSAINQAIVISPSLEDVFTAACRACVVVGGYSLAWIGLVDALGEKIEVGQTYGENRDFLTHLHIDVRPDRANGYGPSASAFREQRPYLCPDFQNDPATAPWRSLAAQYGIHACIALPIHHAGAPRGVLTAYGLRAEAFDSEAHRVLDEITHALSFAIRHFADEAEKRSNAAALQESEALLLEAQKVAALGHWIYQIDSRTLSWSAQVFRLFDQDPAQAPSSLDALTDHYLPESASRLEAAIAQVSETGTRIELELRVKQTAAYHSLAVIPRFDSEGRISGLYGTIQDITEHKQTEAKLIHLADELMHAAREVADLYQNAPCGYHSLDRNGVYCQVNDTELHWLGYTRSEMVGKMNLADLLSPASLPAFQRCYPQFRETGALRDLEVALVRKDGSLLPVLISATAVVNEAGEFSMSRSTLYDMTERHKMEKDRADYASRLAELSRHLVAVQETARRKLSGDLHDRTSPNLAAIDINLRLITLEFGKDIPPDLVARLEDTQALIKDTTASIREICADLRPPVLDYAGLSAALDTYTQQFSSRTGIAITADCGNRNRRLAPNVESLLFRIAQECLTNAAKHARATTIDLKLENDASPTLLTIRDDGDGFSLDELGQAHPGCGLGILNMREMAEFAGGQFSIMSTPGEGTRIRVEIP